MNATDPSRNDTEPEIPETPDGALVPADALPSTGLLSFYDRLREMIVAAVERRGGKTGSRTAETLLLVPDIFILLVRLMLDRDVPQSTRMLVGSTLAYFVLPVDFLPEAFVGAAGFVDDLVLAVAVLSQAFGRELEPYAEKYWSGSKSLRTVLGDVLEAAQSLVGYNVYEKLRGHLAKKGIELKADASEDAEGEAVEPA